MTILSKKQPGTSSGSAQSVADSSSAASTSTISLQPIQVISESVSGAEEATEPKQTLQLFPVKAEPGEAAGLQAKSPLSPTKKTKKSNKRKIKSPNVTINNFVSVNQSSLSSVLSSSASSCSSSVSSNGSLGFNLNFSDADQTEYYRLSDDSDYEEINSENDFFNSSEVKKSSKDPKCKKITKFSSNPLGTLPSNGLSSKCSKMKRNKNTEIKTGDIFNENNNSEDEYEQTPTLLINQEEAFIKSAKTIEELEQNFCRALKEKKGFIIKPMKEDGACLFRAVADQIYGDQEMHSTIRSHCMDYIAKNADYFKQYMTEDIERYLARKRQDNCFGNHIEIIAIAEIYNRPIEVYEYSLEPKNTFQAEFQTDNEPIRLSYHGRMHYNSVVNPFKATIGVGLGLPQLIPGLAEKNLLNEALKKSEEFHIEKTMLDDKLKASDWEATNEELMEMVARESYLQWLKDNEQRDSVNMLQANAAPASCSSWSSNDLANCLSREKLKFSSSSKSSPASSAKASSKISSSVSTNLNKEFEDIDLFALTNQTVDQNTLQDDEDILARVLAESQQEYLDSLKIKHQKQNSSHQF